MKPEDNIARKGNHAQQYLYGIFIVIIVAGLGYALSPFIGYRVVAFMLLVTVSILAMIYDIFPVLIAATFSALVWDYFFIPPKYRLTISDTEDQLLLLMYFVIALVNAVLTSRLRKAENKFRLQKNREKEVQFYNTLLNSLSHELRTPITTIIGAVDNLQVNQAKLSEENKSELIGEIGDASARLNGQVGNLLDMSRLEAGIIHTKKDWCDANELIYSVLNRFPSNGSRKVNVSIAENMPLINVDFVLMQQVLYNILNNAFQYIPEDGIITISVRCGKELLNSFSVWNKVQDTLVITISDNGPGFPNDEISKVFQKFYRLHGTHAGGTGLGLSIVKGFIELMRGKVELENQPTGGAKFTISIPCELSYVNALKNE